MRDLYRRLGVRPTASLDEIKNALSLCKDPKLREDATAVLLSGGRRKAYDQVHTTLTDIGKLRAKLRLNQGDNWQSLEMEDFRNHAFFPYSARQALEDKLKPHANKPEAKSPLRRLLLGLIPFIVAPIIVSVFFYLTSSKDPSAANPSYESLLEQQQTTSSNANKTSVTSSQVSEDPQFNEPILPLPATGSIIRHTDQKGDAPLQIKTNPGANYLVRLEDTSSGQDVMDIFVRGGTTVEVEVPLGAYQLKYASGTSWYGRPHLFGPNTSYSKADTPFRFYIDGQRISGYTVTLYQVRDGNLRTSRLSPDQF